MTLPLAKARKAGPANPPHSLRTHSTRHRDRADTVRPQQENTSEPTSQPNAEVTLLRTLVQTGHCPSLPALCAQLAAPDECQIDVCSLQH